MMSKRKKRNSIHISLLVIFTFLGLVGNVRLAYADSYSGQLENTAFIIGTPEPDDGTEDPSEEGTVEPSPAPHPSTPAPQVIEIEKHILFPYETLQKAVLEALAGMVNKALSGVQAELPGMVNKAVQSVLPEVGQKGIFETSRLKLWRITIVIAGILMPLTLVIGIGSALKEGASSVTGYAGAREALVTWFVGVGAAIASYFLLSKGIELSQLAGRAILEQIITEADWNIGQNLVATMINIGRINALPIVLKMFLGIFAILLIVAITACLSLSLLAREVILLMLVGTAPIIIILGTLGPLRWLAWTWSKISVITLLLGPANFLLIGGAFLITQEANLSELMRDSLLGIFVALGFISVLIGINGLVGKMVYGSVIEVAQKAWQSTMAVVKMAATLGAAGAGIAAAPAIGSALGGTSAAGAGITAAESGATVGAATSQASSAGNTFNTYSKAMAQANLTKSIGQALAATGNPIAKGFGAGLNIGASKTAFDQIHADNAMQGTPEMPSFNGDVDVHSAINNARNTIRERYPDLASGETSKLDKGTQLAQDTFKTFESMGVDTKQALWELGYLKAGGNPQDAATQYAGQIIGGYTKGREWGIASPSPIMGPGTSVSAQDVNIASAIIRSRGAEPDLTGLERMSRASHLRRTVLQESTDSVLSSGVGATGGAGIDNWIQDTYMELRMRAKSRNDEFKKAFGLD
jgi:hypothetical protein